MSQRSHEKIVNEWNKLNKEYQILANGGFDIFKVPEQNQLKERMTDLEKACVIEHSISPELKDFLGDKSLPDAAQPYSNTNLMSGLRSYDDVAIAIFQTRIYGAIAIEDNTIWALIEEDCGDHINALSESDSDCIKYLLAQQTIPYIASAYEISLVKLLGKPQNVYVAQNVRKMFKYAVAQSFQQNHGVELSEDDASTLINNYCDGLKEMVEDILSGEIDSFVNYFYTMRLNYCGNAITDEFVSKIGNIFLQFVNQVDYRIESIIAGKLA